MLLVFSNCPRLYAIRFKGLWDPIGMITIIILEEYVGRNGRIFSKVKRNRAWGLGAWALSIMPFLERRFGE